MEEDREALAHAVDEMGNVVVTGCVYDLQRIGIIESGVPQALRAQRLKNSISLKNFNRA